MGFRKYFFFICFIVSYFQSHAGWNNLNTGINDNLSGVVFWGTKGIVTGHKGIYITSNGGSGSSSWGRFNITGNYVDSVIYNNTRFTHAYSEPGSFGLNKAVVCGKDTVNNRPIVMLFDLTGFSYTFIYVGAINAGGLNHIAFSNPYYYVVGENGQFLRFHYTGTGIYFIPTPFTHNLSSVSFSGGNFCMGTTGYMINGVTSSNNYTFTVNQSSNIQHTSVLCRGLNSGVSVSDKYYTWSGISLSSNTNYDFGSLNGRYLISANNNHFVGTDHGIFRSTNTASFLEWQPSSLNLKINCIAYFGASTPVMYACGENGVLLTTTDYGGGTKPFVKISSNGGCIGAPVSITSVLGTSNYCNWYINNALVSSSCITSFQYSFPSIGNYTVQLISFNNYSSDTSTVMVSVVNPPVINLSLSLNKHILCKQEPILITIDTAQQNIYYTLKRIGDVNAYGTSLVGQNNSLNFSSLPLSQDGNYYLQASYSNVSCSKNFTDTIKIVVEKTHANFHSATINATTGESVIYYQQCVDAQNYIWKFNGGSPDITVSSVPDPTVSYASASVTDAKLICWSNNGCYDSLQKPSTTVYSAPPVYDSCWILVNNAPDPTWTGLFYFDISEISTSKSGFLACGTAHKPSFASHYGDSLKLPAVSGGYIGKYDFDGVLKWTNYTNQSDYNLSSGSSFRDIITSVKEAPSGDIYISGKANEYFYDNRGDSVLSDGYNTSYPSGNYFIAKMDSSGKLLWKLSANNGFVPIMLETDRNNNVYAYSESYSPTMAFKLNGTPSDTLTNSIAGTNKPYILKVGPAGNILWDAKLSANSTNNIKGMTLKTDSTGNLYFHGSYKNAVNVYSAGSSTFATLPTSVTLQGNKSFVIKYDINGQLKWTHYSYVMGNQNNCSAYWNSMDLDANGNVFVTGSNDAPNGNETIVFNNSNGTQSYIPSSRYFTLKVNKNGIFSWINSITQGIADGWSVNVNNDEVSSLGRIGNYAIAPTLNFKSQNGAIAALPIGSNDNFIIVYDTLGNLKRALKNASNPHSPTFAARYYSEIIRSKNSDYYVAENLRLMSPSSYQNFNQLITKTNGYDGVITKFSGLNCAIVVDPGFSTNIINENSTQQVAIYPNPATNYVYIKKTDAIRNLRIKLLNSTGQEVRVSYRDDIVDLSGLNPGLYSVLIFEKDRLIHIEKMVKE